MAKNGEKAPQDDQASANANAQNDQTVQQTADANTSYGDVMNENGAAPAAQNTTPVPPVTPEPPEATPAAKKGNAGKFRVKNPECAGLTLYGVNGNQIAFDAGGEADVDAEDFEHFLKVPGYEKA